jgi:hypothetical protein
MMSAEIISRLEALLRRVKTLRRQVYGENYDLDIWREVELELEAIISDLCKD